jgi:membrane protease subunit HflC
MDQTKSLTIIVSTVVAIVILLSSFFTVDEREKVIVLQLGKIERTDIKAGMYFRIPLVQTVRKFDSRVLTMDAEPESFLTAEKKNVVVDSFVKWRISDVGRYYTAMGGSEELANQRLSQIMKDGLRGEFAKRTIQEVVSGERAEIMKILAASADKQVRDFGMEVIDVRIKRIDLKGTVSDSVYRRMESDRTRVAKDLRSKGAEAAERIRADADRQRTVILAEAYRESEQLRGVGDATASQIYAKAFQKDAEFYSFYRSLTAYKESFKNKKDLMVIQPNTDFFRYFGNSDGRK